jgi:hypothetical protein
MISHKTLKDENGHHVYFWTQHDKVASKQEREMAAREKRPVNVTIRETVKVEFPFVGRPTSIGSMDQLRNAAHLWRPEYIEAVKEMAKKDCPSWYLGETA